MTEWSILNSLMKSTNEKKEEESKSNSHPSVMLTGDAFFDNIGKYCNQHAIDSQLNQKYPMIESAIQEENVNDSSGEMEANIPEESERQNIIPSQKIEDIKTNKFRIKLTNLREVYNNENIVRSAELEQ